MTAVLYNELAEWAIARREIERRGDQLLVRAQLEGMSFADVLMALNSDVVQGDDEYPRRELEGLLLAIRSRLEQYGRVAVLTPTEVEYRAGAA